MTESYAKLIEGLRTLGPDLSLLLPESALVVAIVWGLLSRCFPLFSHVHAYWLGLPLMLMGLVVLGIEIANPTPPTLAFGGQLRIDTFSQVCRFLILAFATCTLLMGLTTRLPDRHDSADVTTLVLGSTLGLMVLVSANTLLTMFLAMEMGSLPGYALAGLMKGQRRGSESALKYLLYGSAASSVALFGISLITVSMGSTALESLGRGWVVLQQRTSLISWPCWASCSCSSGWVQAVDCADALLDARRLRGGTRRSCSIPRRRIQSRSSGFVVAIADDGSDTPGR